MRPRSHCSATLSGALLQRANEAGRWSPISSSRRLAPRHHMRRPATRNGGYRSDRRATPGQQIMAICRQFAALHLTSRLEAIWRQPCCSRAPDDRRRGTSGRDYPDEATVSACGFDRAPRCTRCRCTRCPGGRGAGRHGAARRREDGHGRVGRSALRARGQALRQDDQPDDAPGKPKTCSACKGADKDQPSVGLVTIKVWGEDGKLEVRGSLGPFYKTQTWNKAD